MLLGAYIVMDDQNYASFEPELSRTVHVCNVYQFNMI